MYKKGRHIHFVGIGGIGMSGIAEVLMNLGYKVSGSDLADTDITRRLAGLGAIIRLGHDGAWVEGADVVVVSSAVRQDNPEVVAAHESHIPVIPRAEMLAELMRLKKFGIAIAGAHGKTTTTSLVGWMMAQAGMDPTVIIGGKVDSFGSNAKLGQGDFLVAEADESDGSFLRLSPALEVVTNIDREHLDFYSGLDAIKDAYLSFIEKIPFYGAAIICLDDPVLAELLPAIKKRIITYGLSNQADVHGRNLRTDGFATCFEVLSGQELLGEMTIAAPGRHSVLNALAAVAVGLELEIPFKVIAEGLGGFSGVQRRMQIKGEVDGIMVVDDYGHHPTEIRATLEALRQARAASRLVVLFQPHRYSRTQALFKEFCTAFHDADQLLVTEIYAASERPIDGVTGESLVEGIRLHGHKQVRFVAESEELAAAVLPGLAAGDVVLTLGAGSIWRAGEQLLGLLGQ